MQEQQRYTNHGDLQCGLDDLPRSGHGPLQ